MGDVEEWRTVLQVLSNTAARDNDIDAQTISRERTPIRTYASHLQWEGRTL